MERVRFANSEHRGARSMNVRVFNRAHLRYAARPAAAWDGTRAWVCSCMFWVEEGSDPGLALAWQHEAARRCEAPTFDPWTSSTLHIITTIPQDIFKLIIDIIATSSHRHVHGPPHVCQTGDGCAAQVETGGTPAHLASLPDRADHSHTPRRRS